VVFIISKYSTITSRDIKVRDTITLYYTYTI